MKNFRINSSDTLLLMIDIQDKLFKVMSGKVQENLVRNCSILIKTASEFNIPLIVTEQYRKGLGDTIPELKQLTGTSLNLEKFHFDSMKDDEIKKAVFATGKNTVIVTGTETHICVFQTALSLLAEGRRVVVVMDGVGSRRKKDWEFALRALSEAGAVIYPTETIVFMLLEKAGTPQFKALSPLFK
jgi:isochorismate hydrolase